MSVSCLRVTSPQVIPFTLSTPRLLQITHHCLKQAFRFISCVLPVSFTSYWASAWGYVVTSLTPLEEVSLHQWSPHTPTSCPHCYAIPARPGLLFSGPLFPKV
jgi:DNA-binding helix-hairpin-helix protein with protein kinase domain